MGGSASDNDEEQQPPQEAVEDSAADADAPAVYTESAFLRDVLLGEMSLTPSKLLALDDSIVLRYSLLISSLIAHLGSLVGPSVNVSSSPDGTPTIRRDSAIANPHFLSLLRAFSLKCMSSRPLKLRFALLLDVAKLDVLEKFFNPIVHYDDNCYDSILDVDAAAGDIHFASDYKQDASDNVEPTEKFKQMSIASVGAEDLLQSDKLLREYAQRRFFHPRSGIALKAKRRGLHSYSNAFSEYNAVLYLMQDLKVSEKAVASAVGTRMVEAGIIERVSKSFGGSTKSAFGFGREVYVRADAVARPSVSFRALDTKDDDDSPSSAIDVMFGMDVVDMQSLAFWKTNLFAKTLEEGGNFGTFAVVHPMAIMDAEADNEDQVDRKVAGSHGGFVVHRVDVKKVFSSMAKPGIISMSSYPTGAVLLPEEQAEVVEIAPRMIAKTGDNLLQDLSVSIAFRIMNHVWQKDIDRFGGADKAPFSFAYDVLPTGPRAGLLEVVSGLSSLNDYDWAAWTAKYADNKDALDSMVRSAAGCSIAQYVLGCGDRHFDNICIVEDEVLMHIDFGMILGENPAFKTPRFSISGAQEKAFKDVKIWEPFVEMCGQAYLSLRSRSAELMRLVALVLHHAGRPRTKILKYLASKSSLNIDEDDEEKAAKFVCDQVRSSSTNWELILRKFTHDRVDPLFFKAVEAAPAGLVAAVEKLYDKP